MPFTQTRIAFKERLGTQRDIINNGQSKLHGLDQDSRFPMNFKSPIDLGPPIAKISRRSPQDCFEELEH